LCSLWKNVIQEQLEKKAGKSLRRECPFEIKLSCSKRSKYLEIKKVCFEHNHTIGEEIFAQSPKKPSTSSDNESTIFLKIKMKLI
jgi:hypothetical protein